MDDVDVIELNEAFSAQSIAVLHDLNIASDDERLNIDGGALAIGHPLGAKRSQNTWESSVFAEQSRWGICISLNVHRWGHGNCYCFT